MSEPVEREPEREKERERERDIEREREGKRGGCMAARLSMTHGRPRGPG